MVPADRPSDRPEYDDVHVARPDGDHATTTADSRQASAAPDGSPRHEPGPVGEQPVETLMYRRAPKLPVFLVLGGALGAVTGMFVGVLGSGNAMFTTGQVVGYMVAIFTLLGLSFGAIVAIVVDRVSLKRSREVAARVEHHEPEGHPDVRE